MNVAERLFAEGHDFSFFQAVRVLARLQPNRRPVGQGGPPREEIVRFRAWQSLSFPASVIYEVQPATAEVPVPAMTVTHFGLTGPNGILPRHYTELILRLEREVKGPERYALRAWLDLFNHRLISLFYRAWEKYRFYLAYERRGHEAPEPDPFTQALFSFVGLGLPRLRNRLRVARLDEKASGPREQVLAKIDDLALLYYGGLLAQRPRNAVALEAILTDFFGLPARVRQFHGQWLPLGTANQSRPGAANAMLGRDLVAGERVWDVQSKIRLRLGPLDRARFDAFMPDPAPVPERKTFFLLVHLVRLYLGPDLDFDVQLVLRARDVPACHLDGDGPRLGWNTWLCSRPPERDAEDAVFAGEEIWRVA
jgi:type VI secretion system protein ImpH